MDEDFGGAIATRRVLVAEDRQAAPARPVGYALFDPRVENDRAGFLDAVAVAPSHQGRGIGPRLIAAAEREMREAGAATVRLYTNAAMTGNLALYPRLGYREAGRAVQDGFDRVFFEKALPPARPLTRSVPGLFGRRSVHGHRAGPQYARFALDLSRPFPGAEALFFASVRTMRLEVGFGSGEHLLHHARTAPSVGLIGVEPFETGIRRAARDTDAEGLANVRLYMGDARDVLAWLPDDVLERVDILYPDPWPKRKHWKRRFISLETLDVLARVLVPGGTVRFASDIAPYVEWTRAHVAEHPAFALAADSDAPWEGWPGTRYEAKGLREGRPPRYLTLRLQPV
jgi:tRNA (guanine-N7-)-methyltransferase